MISKKALYERRMTQSSSQNERDTKIGNKLLQLSNMENVFIHAKALNQLNETDDGLLGKFPGRWQLEKSSDFTVRLMLVISLQGGEVAGTISTENAYYSSMLIIM